MPRTFVFNTLFNTRLSTGGFEYGGVARWTKRLKVDIRRHDLILVPVTLGNSHWVLSGVDMEQRKFICLESMRAPDSNNVVGNLRKRMRYELKGKHGADAAEQLVVAGWYTMFHKYYVRCNFKVAGHLGASSGAIGRMAHIPEQTDGESCGVFAVMIADCLALSMKVFFTQADMATVRARMAIDIFCEQLST